MEIHTALSRNKLLKGKRRFFSPAKGSRARADRLNPGRFTQGLVDYCIKFFLPANGFMEFISKEIDGVLRKMIDFLGHFVAY